LIHLNSGGSSGTQRIQRPFATQSALEYKGIVKDSKQYSKGHYGHDLYHLYISSIMASFIGGIGNTIQVRHSLTYLCGDD
jgi:hypothetical protein